MLQPLRILLMLSFAALAAPAVAQQAQWRVTPYAWLAGFKGDVGLQGDAAGLSGRTDVDPGYDLKTVGAMLHLDYRSGRVSAFGDWTYANVKGDSPTPLAALYAGTDVKVRGNIVEANVGYDMLATPDAAVDVFGGVRYYDLNVDLGLREGVLPGTVISGSKTWADGIIGVRGTTRFADNWEAIASADIGGGGSDLAWQLYAGIGYRASWGTVLAGWRHLHVNYESSSYKLDGALTGPFIGASFQF